MKKNNSNSLFIIKFDVLNTHLTNTIHRMNDSIKNQSYTADKFRMLSTFGSLSIYSATDMVVIGESLGESLGDSIQRGSLFV